MVYHVYGGLISVSIILFLNSVFSESLLQFGFISDQSVQGPGFNLTFAATYSKFFLIAAYIFAPFVHLN